MSKVHGINQQWEHAPHARISVGNVPGCLLWDPDSALDLYHSYHLLRPRYGNLVFLNGQPRQANMYRVSINSSKLELHIQWM